ncbi:MAG TPA: hypothetical protein VKY73_13360 [Polyangiaceae bacterium]|nr:hypothetical protein [Polyangiaceae bacterium]
MSRRTPLHTGFSFAAKSWLRPPGTLGFSTLEWLPARVPGHVHLDLVRAGVIADPFAHAHELGCQWVDEEDWSYRTSFSFVPDPELPRRVLRFEGLDTVATVSLNGEVVAEHDDMFVPLEVDVSTRLRTGENELRVDFASAARVGRERRARYLEQEGLPETVERFPERAFVRKAQYMFGWDWGPRLVSAGIWKPVTLIEHRGRIRTVRVLQRHLSDGSVELCFFSDIDGEGTVLHALEGHAGFVEDGAPLRVERPELWWPAGHGAQHLYTVESVLVPEGTRATSEVEHVALDGRAMRIGLRTVRLVREPDRFGESFELEVNGRRLYALGANWIPDHSFPSVVSEARVRRALERARDLGMNMLRVWGGGVYESDAFYDAADELGLLVWQDFPFACSYYPDDAAAERVLRAEARAEVARIQHHASLALYCGNNENLTMWQDKWGVPADHPPRYYGEALYERVLPEVLKELDPERPYVPSSPAGGERANSGGTGDQHYWDVWHGRGDYPYYADSTARFSSEFGFAAAPGPRAFARMVPDTPEPLSLDVRHPIARFHDKTAKGYDTFVGYVELHYPPARSLEEWMYTSQLNQRDALRFGIEHYRRSEFCKGSLIWQLNDCWPVQSWAVIDSEGEYKAAAYELRRLYASALASVEPVGETVRLWVVLDNATAALRGEAAIEVRALADGRVLARSAVDVTLAPGERRIATELAVGAFDPTTVLVVGSFAGSRTTRLLCEPKHARVPVPALRARVEDAGLVVESDVPVLDLYLWDAGGRLALDDNFVTLPAPGRVVLRARGEPVQLLARSLAGRHPIPPL